LRLDENRGLDSDDLGRPRRCVDARGTPVWQTAGVPGAASPNPGRCSQSSLLAARSRQRLIIDCDVGIAGRETLHQRHHRDRDHGTGDTGVAELVEQIQKVAWRPPARSVRLTATSVSILSVVDAPLRQGIARRGETPSPCAHPRRTRSAFAAFRSAVSKPSLNRSYTDARRSRASEGRPC
jgi:hypothetical protein